MAQEVFTTLCHICPGLTNDNMSEALAKWFNKNMTFTHWEYVGDTGKGDSYLSELIRIKIFGNDNSGKSDNIQVVLKNIPQNVSRRKTFRSHEFFKNEINYYKYCLPELLRFQASKNVKEPYDNYTKLFYSYSNGINDCIILIDVSTENFVPAVRQKGIDLDHCKVTLKTFAKFHAISFAMRDQEPEKFNEISTKVFEVYYHDRLWDWYERFWARLSGIAIDAVQKEYPNTIYEEKVKQFAVPETFKKMCAAVMDQDGTGVISHGDAWTNNFLYKYAEDKKPLDAKMIDFQLARCASPVLDIAFFFYACTSQDLREKHYDYLLKYYYDILTDHIRQMGSDSEQLYSWETFMSEIKKYSFFGLAFSFESMPFIILDPEDAVNMEIEGEEKLNIDDVWQIKPIKTKEGRLREADCIVHAVDQGYI